jgi:SAM-dependent methyltransferase
VVEVLRSLQLPATGKALDFGCGNGVFTRIIKDVFPAWEVYGVEISQVAVDNAKRKFPDCHFFNATETAAHQHQFDFLFSHHVIEHVQDLRETFDTINSYLKPVSSQLHILPCGNEGSYEHSICLLKKNGIEKDKDNRFFFEEPGHLRRLNTMEFAAQEKNIGFSLERDFYSNQRDGAINWITKSSPRFVKKLTDSSDAINPEAAAKLKELRKKLVPLTYRQFAYAKYWGINSKWHKKLSDRIKLAILYIPAMLSKPLYMSIQEKAHDEWKAHKTEKNGSEMFLFFTRKS